MSDFSIKRGDLDPAITATLLQDGRVIDLTGCTVQFIMRSRGVVKVNAAATVVSETAGSVRYDWQDTDTDTAGQYLAEWEITKNERRLTIPTNDYIHIDIVDDLGDAP